MPARTPPPPPHARPPRAYRQRCAAGRAERGWCFEFARYGLRTLPRLYHTGLIAQDVEQAVLDTGLTTHDFAALCYNVDADGNKSNYGIRYEELVSMCIYEIQKLKKQVEELKTIQNDFKEKLDGTETESDCSENE